jgi:hypothetical protein
MSRPKDLITTSLHGRNEQSFLRTHAPSRHKASNVNTVTQQFWTEYIIGLAFITAALFFFWLKSRKIKAASDFNLSSDEEKQLLDCEAKLQRSENRARDIFREGSRAELKVNTDRVSYHRGSKLGQKLNHELEGLGIHIHILRRTVERLGRLPSQRLDNWSHAYASRLSVGIAAVVYCIIPLSTRDFYFLHFVLLGLILSAMYLAIRKLLKPWVVRWLDGIDSFWSRWSRYSHMQTSEEEFELLIEDEEEPYSDDSGDNFQEVILKKPDSAGAWHDVLGVSVNASREEIAAARKQRAKQFHSDRLQGVEGLSPEFKELADKRMVEINKAYEQGIAGLQQNT